jgi:hypothetical protein
MLELFSGRDQERVAHALRPAHALADVLAEHDDVRAGHAREVAGRSALDRREQDHDLGAGRAQACDLGLGRRSRLAHGEPGCAGSLRLDDAKHADVDAVDLDDPRGLDESGAVQVDGQPLGRDLTTAVFEIVLAERATTERQLDDLAGEKASAQLCGGLLSGRELRGPEEQVPGIDQQGAAVSSRRRPHQAADPSEVAQRVAGTAAWLEHAMNLSRVEYRRPPFRGDGKRRRCNRQKRGGQEREETR